MAAVMTNKHDEAIAAFYTEDASLQEPDAEPRRGLAQLVAGEKAMFASVASVVTHPPDFVAVEGDRVAIHWVFDFVNMYEVTTQRDIQHLENKDVTGRYGQAFHVIGDLVIESIDLCDDRSLDISIGS
ncbi:MAG: nuclear transport factor 2 family protein [Deltaproteobacteria bacterium]